MLKKLYPISFIIAFILASPSLASANEEGDNFKTYEEIEKEIRSQFSDDEIELLETLEKDEDVIEAVQKRYEYDSEDILYLEVSDVEEFSNEAGLSIETSVQYIDLLNQVLETSASLTPKSVASNSDVSIQNHGCGYTEEIQPHFTYETYFCIAHTERMLSNLTNQARIFGGISLVTAFWKPYVSLTAGMSGFITSELQNEINSVFAESGYTGVINRVSSTPMTPDTSRWRPLGTDYNWHY